MHDHDAEEYRVEPRERALKAGYETPSEREIEVRSVVNLARVLIPAITQQAVAAFSLDILRVLDLLPRQLRKGLAVL